MMDLTEADVQDEESTRRANKEPLNSSEDLDYFPELDKEPEIAESKSFLSLQIILHKTVSIYIKCSLFCGHTETVIY